MKTLLAIALLASQATCLANTKSVELSGGATTVFDTSHNAFSLPARNLGILRRDNFFIGNAFFKQPWVQAPASTSARDGLGPVFNTNTCQGCHVKDGRGRPPLAADEPFISALIRLSITTKTGEQKDQAIKSGVIPDPNYGDQLQNNAIHGVKAEGKAKLSYTEHKITFHDGVEYGLLTPKLEITDLNYGELSSEILTSVRTAPAMIGLGLLEAIEEADILSLADEQDTNGDGISGRPNKVWDVKHQKMVMGRFGWKANQPNVEQQSAGAFHGDMGITSELFPLQNCSEAQEDCHKATHGGIPEISAEILDKVVFYASTLAVPARRNVKDPKVLTGEKLFNEVGCNSCHIATFKTGEKAGFPELSNQTIHPYTDLLLHDMGEGLSDKRPDFLATGNEWRTPPLWGIGLVETVNKHTRFLHDGRARNLMEAVLWHGGEAETAKQSVLKFNQAEREALIAFLKSL